MLPGYQLYVAGQGGRMDLHGLDPTPIGASPCMDSDDNKGVVDRGIARHHR